MIFNFIVHRLRWLGRVPLLPQFFDTVLTACTALCAPEKMRAIELLEESVCERFGARRGVHRFGGLGFFVGRSEIGHVHGNGLVDVFVGRANRDRIVADAHAQRHHVFPASGWVSYWLHDRAEVDGALQLFNLAVKRLQLPTDSREMITQAGAE